MTVTPVAAWLNAKPSGSPPTLATYGAAYFPPLAKHVFFGGTNGTTSNVTYTYDAVNNVWATLSTVHSPGARWATGQMAYDAHRNVIVLFGGYNGSFLQDTWEFNGTDWAQITPTHKPAGREQGAMAFDQANNVIVLYSGAPVSGTILDDTWTYDGTDWTQVSSTHTPGNMNGNGSKGRYEGKMCWDPVAGAVLLVGGLVNESTTDTHVYHWSGTDWSSTTPASPLTLTTQGLVASADHAIVFGNAQSADVNLYQWTGSDWQQFNTNGLLSASAIYDINPTYDSALNALVWFGGRLFSSNAYQSAVWLNPLPDAAPSTGQFALYHPASYDASESNGGTKLVNVFNVGAGAAAYGRSFGLPASGMYAVAITPDNTLGIVTELQVNTTTTDAHAWVFSVADPSIFTQITLSECQARGVAIPLARIGGNWYALVCSGGGGMGFHHTNGTVDVINLSGAPPSVVATLSISGTYPVFVAITPDGTTALVVDGGNASSNPNNKMDIYTIDLTVAPVTSWTLTGRLTGNTTHNCQDLVISPDGSTAWVADSGASIGGANQIYPINVSAMTFGSAIACASAPGTMVITNDSTKLWVGCAGANKLLRIDTASKTVDETVTFTGTANGGGSAYPLSITPDGTTLYFAEGGPPGHLWTMPIGSTTPADTGLKIPGFGSYIAGRQSVAPVAQSGGAMFLALMGL